MPLTSAEAFHRSHPMGILAPWSDWPVPEMPPLSQDPWPNAEWHRDISDEPVDLDRTNVMHTHPDHQGNVRLVAGNTPHGGTSGGFPYSLVEDDSVRLRNVWQTRFPIVWDWRRGFVAPYARVPLVDPVPRRGDPNPSAAEDGHFICWDRYRDTLHESITMGKRWWIPGWSTHHDIRWHTDRPWNDRTQPQRGAMAINTPILPLLIRWEEIQRGYINHACSITVYSYSNRHIVGIARGTDGVSGSTSPLYAGDVLRLKQSALDASYSDLSSTDRVVARAWVKHGLILSDKNFTHNMVRATMDRRFTHGDGISPACTIGGKFKMSDFEVIRQEGS